MLLPSHGANPEKLTELLQLPLRTDAIDFSVNTAPFPLQAKITANWSEYLETITKYPDPLSEQLKEVIAGKEQLATSEILVGNGAAQLIFLIAMFFAEKRVVIVEPTFSEYRDACKTFSCQVEAHHLLKPWQLDIEKLINTCKNKDLLFICNPNNPTGVAYSAQELEFLIARVASLGVTVVVDEAFYDFKLDGATVIELVKKYPNLVVLRSLTKMYGIAGIRLGYLAANSTFIKNISPFQNPWSVNGLAQKIGSECLQDTAYVKKIQEFFAQERQRIFPILENYDYEISKSEVNFYLLKEKNKQEDCLPLIKYLIKHGIIPRHTYNFPSLDGNYLRLAIKTKAENNQLLTVLQGWIRQC